jgi:hypothetical protein
MSTEILELNPKTRKTVDKVMSAVRFCGYTEQISGVELDRVIIKTHGYDPRTVARIRELLVVTRRIAPINQYVFRIMPEGQSALDQYDIAAPMVEVEGEAKE